MCRFEEVMEMKMKIYNNYKEALQNISDESIFFKDETRKVIIALTPVAMDGSIECKVFPIAKENEIISTSGIDNMHNMLFHCWLDAYFGESSSEEQEHFSSELERQLLTFDKDEKKIHTELTDIELLEQGLVLGTREEAMQYHQAYKRYGTSHMHPVDAIFSMFQSRIPSRKTVEIMSRLLLDVNPKVLKEFGFYNQDIDTAIKESAQYLKDMKQGGRHE